MAFLQQLLAIYYPMPQIVVDLDNTSSHRSMHSLTVLSLFGHWACAVWLLPYYSILNPVEHSWQCLKDHICADKLLPPIGKLVTAVEQELLLRIVSILHTLNCPRKWIALCLPKALFETFNFPESVDSMEPTYSTLLIFMLLMILINSILIMTLIYRVNEFSKLFESKPELVVGEIPPDFKARLLSDEPVSLASYRGKSTLFIFVSPRCSTCRSVIPGLKTLAQQAKQLENLDFICVVEAEKEGALLFRNEMGIALPIIVAPRDKNEFARDYNPSGAYPYYCLVDAQGIVKSRDVVGGTEWKKLEAQWGSSGQANTEVAAILKRYG